jgi:hypothetical protein
MQLGVILSSGDNRYGIWRQGTLGRTAVNAQCPAPDEHVRFQAGPFYDFDPHNPRLLADWGASYLDSRPPDKHPEEWRLSAQHPQAMINDRMAAITDRIRTLQVQQDGYDFNCRALQKCEDPQKHEARRLETERLIEEAAQRRTQLECELAKKCGDVNPEAVPR